MYLGITKKWGNSVASKMAVGDHQRGGRPRDGFDALILLEHKKVTGCARRKNSLQKRDLKMLQHSTYYSVTKSKPFNNLCYFV